VGRAEVGPRREGRRSVWLDAPVVPLGVNLVALDEPGSNQKRNGFVARAPRDIGALANGPFIGIRVGLDGLRDALKHDSRVFSACVAHRSPSLFRSAAGFAGDP
jgi:hypothetical protein